MPPWLFGAAPPTSSSSGKKWPLAVSHGYSNRPKSNISNSNLPKRRNGCDTTDTTQVSGKSESERVMRTNWFRGGDNTPHNNGGRPIRLNR